MKELNWLQYSTYFFIPTLGQEHFQVLWSRPRYHILWPGRTSQVTGNSTDAIDETVCLVPQANRRTFNSLRREDTSINYSMLQKLHNWHTLGGALKLTDWYTILGQASFCWVVFKCFTYWTVVSADDAPFIAVTSTNNDASEPAIFWLFHACLLRHSRSKIHHRRFG